MPTKKEKDPRPKERNSVVFVTEFKHWRSGKLIKAVDYGLKAFPLLVRA